MYRCVRQLRSLESRIAFLAGRHQFRERNLDFGECTSSAVRLTFSQYFAGGAALVDEYVE